MRGFPPFSQGRKAKRSKRIQNKTPEPGEAGPSSFGSSARELEFGEAGKDTEVIVLSDTDDDDDEEGGVSVLTGSQPVPKLNIKQSDRPAP